MLYVDGERSNLALRAWLNGKRGTPWDRSSFLSLKKLYKNVTTTLTFAIQHEELRRTTPSTR